MAIAYVLVSAETGVESEVFSKLAKMRQVKEVYVVYGIYDIVAMVEAPNIEALKEVEVALEELRSLDHIKATMTLIVTESSMPFLKASPPVPLARAS